MVDDTIVLDKAIFSALATGQLSAAEFVTGTQALDANDHIIYNKTAGTLLYDADGAGGAAAIQFATISKSLSMTYLDFVVEDTNAGVSAGPERTVSISKEPPDGR